MHLMTKIAPYHKPEPPLEKVMEETRWKIRQFLFGLIWEFPKHMMHIFGDL